MPTIREIAAKAGYSPATVSRLLNNDPTFSISDHARQKILQTAQNLNYQQPNTTHGLTYQVAVIFAVQPKQELEDIYFSNLRQGLVEHGKQANLDLTFYPDIDHIPADIDGVMAVGEFDTPTLKHLRQLTPHRIFVDSNPDPRHFNSVQPNLQAITEYAIDQLIAAGKTPIGLINGGYWSKDQQVTHHQDPRQKYFESRLRELQLFDERFMFVGGSFSVASGYQLGQQVVQSLSRQALPKGFLIGSDPLAVGVLQAFNENKITVPADTSIISINDIDIARYVSPPLTTFHIDTDDIAAQAIATLKDTIIFDRPQKRMVLVDAKLVYRKSFLKPSTD
ncbi:MULTISPECIES: LacI family DNA-binding transcriptional regulator [Lactiplantibacillus]|jgi:LacI family transcriptional regulator|uniref:LacI family DNA-binding transcriptional regulator n=1 Tax=Lactiplantibacillus pentosus TaxID=1589 RepID=A0AAP5PZD3_LACPE|nr:MULTISPECIES: LacI family DNA-binding transcriptional regulator [Lactiplantibacillus]ASG80009.1 transcriptional regulator [Lactiplantibacillus pentosus]MBU7460355.1 LacI family DNA-binding transcriptional regulator [Lactiplantibacillus pentosus]MBU7477236.1 LacI family DNA-binding transcriptional regulator [Lactiplantibacillus pentosus]MBU7484827.1 LacI family DNA-binding transcriptional regulator [Lactiplantibacillus sp. 30.2.29]MBU7486250.1 LacI family DNA-binding transcriptional regulato